jgi:ketosteroid isomerase-like protein
MSRTNAEICQALIDALNRGDVEACVADCHQEVEWESPGVRVEGGEPYRGHEGIRRYFADLDDAWRDIRIDVDEMRDFGDWVLALGRTHVRGRAGGVDFDYEIGTLCELRDGRLVRARVYLDHDEALAAASAVTGANA